MELSDRKEKIVQAVVDNYISKCTPISSSEIKDEYLPALSSATIRNELAALEDMGYLIQPHTSAGRVPTAQAYKLYVEKLMPRQKISQSDINIIKNYFGKKITEIDELLKNTAKVISEITNLAGVAVKENVHEAQIQNIKIVKISQESALVIVVTNLDIFKDAVVDIPDSVSDDYCDAASSLVTDAFAGHTMGEVIEPNTIIRQVKAEYEEIFEKVVEVLKNYTYGNDEIVLEGGLKILQQPEYSNVDKARAVLKALETKEKLDTALHEQIGDISININPGSGDDDMPGYAIVTTNVNAGGVNVGKAGVIGPMRMDYSKIVSVLNYINSVVNVFGDGNKKK